jgi:plastocyanin
MTSFSSPVAPTRLRLAVPALAAAAFVWSCAASADEARISIDNFTFTPATLTVQAGTTVTWTNADDIPHAVAASDKSFRSKALDTDEHFSFTFRQPGTYAYFCSLHPHMTGRIIVAAP